MSQPRLVRQLGTVSATALVVSNMIGGGIFTTTGFLAGDLGQPSLVIGIWLAGATLRLRVRSATWAHFEFTRTNIAPTILCEKIEELRFVGRFCVTGETFRVRRRPLVAIRLLMRPSASPFTLAEAWWETHVLDSPRHAGNSQGTTRSAPE